jgi:GlcNAc-P-P-Und epimerase
VVKILLTGHSGFLGRVITKALSEKHTVYKLGRSNSDYNVDLSIQIPKFDHLFESVIHVAGKAHSVPVTAAEKQSFIDVNFNGTKNLCQALASLAKLPSSFVFISSVAVYGLEEGNSIKESVPLNGITPYAKSKIMAEEWLINWTNENNIKLVILRLPLVVGPHPRGNLGHMINGIRSGRYASIGKADAKKSMVWAEDVAAIITKAIKIGGVYNLTDGCHPSFSELENIISLAMGKKPPLKIPICIAKIIAFIGDLIGSRSPINRDKLKKITSSLTFDDSEARERLEWKPTPVIQKLPLIL